MRTRPRHVLSMPSSAWRFPAHPPVPGSRLQAAHGTTWDWLFVNLLRRAHGIVFGLVAQVRAQTQNSLVRALATQANVTVLDHIAVLEKTGLVDMSAWPGLN